MTPATIIRRAAEDGVTLSLTPSGTIKVRGNADAVNRWVPILRQQKPALVAALAQSPANDPCNPAVLPGDPEGDREALEERAAIIAEGCGIGQDEAMAEALRHAKSILSAEERAALERLARVWQMDEADQAVMFRQCTRGGVLADGSRISPAEARLFWLAEAGAVH